MSNGDQVLLDGVVSLACTNALSQGKLNDFNRVRSKVLL